ncbi:hypothetical protein AOQ84DRAFT_353516 [Glonium stellatum]|uniref:Uncharacterized protein n=1 Tax=Glonium stellatum TaxID=574774 RepID=A0A8E2F5R3_9PEZI|nr:hypothetical protein AOQ84DRAFT_353516 [Glonium stellatum]
MASPRPSAPAIGSKKTIAMWGSALQGQPQLGHIVTRLINVFFSVWSILLSVVSSISVFLRATNYLAGIRQQFYFFRMQKKRHVSILVC